MKGFRNKKQVTLQCVLCTEKIERTRHHDAPVCYTCKKERVLRINKERYK